LSPRCYANGSAPAVKPKMRKSNPPRTGAGALKAHAPCECGMGNRAAPPPLGRNAA